jgi:hypothetical protein
MGANALAADYATHQVEVLVAIKGSDEEQAKATILLAQALLAEGRTGDARVRAQRALELVGSSDELRPMALILLARVLDLQGDIKEAGRLLDRADVDLRKSHASPAVVARSTALRAIARAPIASTGDPSLPISDRYRAQRRAAFADHHDIRLKLRRMFTPAIIGDDSKPYARRRWQRFANRSVVKFVRRWSNLEVRLMFRISRNRCRSKPEASGTVRYKPGAFRAGSDQGEWTTTDQVYLTGGPCLPGAAARSKLYGTCSCLSINSHPIWGIGRLAGILSALGPAGTRRLAGAIGGPLKVNI